MTPSTETLAEAAARIREMCPIAGTQATNQECALRRDLIEITLAARGVVPGARTWFTAQLTTGQIVGQWASSAEEAELSLGIWWDAACAWVVPDGDLRVRDEYTPSRRGTPRIEMLFPVGPPRVPRDRFAPTESLLDALPTPSATNGRGLA